MFLRQRYEEEPQAVTVNDFKNKFMLSPKGEDLLLHNNFGICNQLKIQAINEGLARVKTIYTSQVTNINSRLVESNFAEVGAYDSLRTLRPNYDDFFADLTSKTYQSQDDFALNNAFTPNVFQVAFGSSVLWEI